MSDNVTMTPETRAKVEAILDRVYAAGATADPIGDVLEELETVFTHAFQAGVVWMWAGMDEGSGMLRDHALAGMTPEEIQAMVDALEKGD